MADTKLSDLTLKTGNMVASDLVEITEGGDTTKSVTGTKITDMVTSGSVVTANTAKISYPSSASTKLAGIEDNATADQTNDEIKAAVEAASDSNTFTDADHTKLNAIEASADVTDTANVTASGALMDSELTDLAGVKGVTISTLQAKPSEGAFVNGDKTKLDAIETSATADQSNAEIRTAVEAASDSNVFTDADHSKLNAIEASADVTDSTNVVAALTAGTGITIASNGTIAAGPLAVTTVQVASSESAQLALTAEEGDVVVRSDEDKTYMHNSGTAGTMDDYTLLATPTGGVSSVNGVTGVITAAHIATAVEAASGSNTFTDADHSKLNAIEASADVTDATNVTAAGALMDSELTDLAGVKGVTISTLQVKPSEGAFANGDKTKLDAIESSATADQTNAEIRAAVEAATDSNVFTNADHTKLNAIEASATADQSAAEIKTLLEDGIDSVHYVDGSIDTAHIGNDQVTADKLANSINSAIAANTAKTGITSGQASAITANTAKVTNATHSGEVTGATALTIANNVVDEANLKVSNTPTNGYALTAQSGNTGGLTWAEMSGGGSGTLTDTLSEGNRTTGTEKIEFRDAAIYINSSADGQLDIVADTEIQIATTTIDINGIAKFKGVSRFLFGTVGGPGIAFDGDSNTGFYRIGSDHIGISTGGVKRFDINSTAATFASDVTLGDPSVTGSQLLIEGFSSSGSQTSSKIIFQNTTAAPSDEVGGEIRIDTNVDRRSYEMVFAVGDSAVLTDALTINGVDSTATFAGDVTLSSASSPEFSVTDTTNTSTFKIVSGNNSSSIGTVTTGHDLYIQTESVTALTIDGETQDATFASDVTVDGDFDFNGPAAATVTANGNGKLATTSSLGALMYGKGSTYDVTLAQGNGTRAMGILTGTVNVDFAGDVTVDKATGGVLTLKRSDTAVVAGDVFGQIDFDTTDATNAGTAVQIRGEATGTSANGEFYVATAEAGTLTDQLHIDKSGLATFAGDVTVSGGDVNINGAANAYAIVNKGATANTGFLRLKAGGSSIWGVGSSGNNNFKIYNYGLTTNSLAINASTDAVTFAGTITGNGSGLTALNGSNISSGTIAAARVATLNQNTTGASGSITAVDTRAAARAPNDYADRAATVEFTNDFPTLGAWGSAITIKGWADGYNSWQLMGNAANNTTDQNLYYRHGLATSWTTLAKIWSDANFTAGTGATNWCAGNDSRLATQTTVTGSSGSCTGNAATVTNGVYTTGTQTIGGAKTFSNNATFAGDVIVDTGANAASITINSPSQVWSGGEDLGGINWYTEDTSGNAPGVIAKMYVESKGGNTLPIAEMVFSSSTAASTAQIEHLRFDPSGGVSTATFAGDVSVETSGVPTLAGGSPYGLLVKSGGANSNGTYQGSIGFTESTGTLVRSAIMSKQTGADNDQNGLAFMTHPSASNVDGAIALLLEHDKSATFAGAVNVAGTLTVDAGSSGMIDFGDVTSAYGRLFADSSGTYVGSKSNHPLKLRTNNAIALTLDTSQNATFAGQLQYVGASAGLVSTTSGTADNTISMANTNNQSYIGINGATGNRFSGSTAYFTTLGTSSAYGLELATNNTVRMSINSAGNATFAGTVAVPSMTMSGYGTPVNTSNLDSGMYGIYNASRTGHIWSMGTAYKISPTGANFGNLYGLAYKHTNNTSGGTMASGHMMVWCQNGSGKAAMGTNIWTSGNVIAYSDARVKTNIEVIDNALDKVCQLSGYTFDRTDQPDLARQTGVIAQEVIKVLPEAVLNGPTDEDPDGHYSVAYGNMVGLLIESTKEINKKVTSLEAENTLLKSQLEAVMARLDKAGI